MAKFVKTTVLAGVMGVALIIFGGCVRVQIPQYIKADHPYVRHMYGDLERITEAVRQVLMRNGWSIERVMNPAVYERSNEEELNGEKDLLIITETKQHPMFLYSSYTHLNVFIHATAEGAQVDVRFGKTTSVGFKQFYNTRNDKLANRLLEQIEQELLERN